MPQKVNPIRLENAEGNGQLAAALFSFFVEKFSHSRLQRDLSDSTVRRNFGVAFGHLLISMNQLGKGLDRLSINSHKMLEEVNSHPEILAEAVQTILRREGVGDGYERAKKFFRGRSFEREKFTEWVETQKISTSAKEKLANLSTSDYSGLASEIVKSSLPKLKERIKKLQ